MRVALALEQQPERLTDVRLVVGDENVSGGGQRERSARVVRM